jgi:hypothetical protein
MQSGLKGSRQPGGWATLRLTAAAKLAAATFDLGRRPAATRGAVTIALRQAIPRTKSKERSRPGDPSKTMTPCVNGVTCASSLFWLPDEAKVETEQEEDEMDDGATTADLRCFDETCPQERHRYISKIEIEQNAR